MKYRFNAKRTRRQRLRIFLGFVVILLAVLVIATIFIRRVYDQNLRPVSNNQTAKIVTITSGLSTNQIADLLHKDTLIRSAWAFEWYARSRELRDQLQAGTYSFNQAQSIPDIVSILSRGAVTSNLVTILPGKRLDQIKASLINSGFSPDSVTAALDPAQYADLPVLGYKPVSASLEGLLYPDSFEKNTDTSPAVIIRESLTEMSNNLTPALQAAFASEGLSTYQGIILASIVGQEVSKPADQPQVAQVFLKRLATNMPLGSDVTAFYGSIVAGHSPSLSFDSPYNTLIHAGLPPTPISTVTASVLNATAHPASTNWLYFVTGDNGTTYFETTLAQHNADVAAYCHQLCAQDSQ